MNTTPVIGLDRQTRFNAIFRMYYNNVVAYAQFYLHDYENAKEVAQNVFTLLWKNLDAVDENVFPYLIVLTKNQCLNSIRRNLRNLKYCKCSEQKSKKDIDLYTLENSSIDVVSAKQLRDILSKAIAALPPKTREAFILNRFHNKTYGEIADLQHASKKNIEYRMTSALKYLKKFLSFYSISV